MLISFEKRKEIGPAIWQYYFRPERPLDYIAGQYVDVHIAAAAQDPRGPMRTFTLTSAPTEPVLSFAVRIDDKPSIYKQHLRSLVAGDEVKIDDAMGDVVLPKLTSIPLLFVAGGLGAASFVAMTKTLTAQIESRNVSLLYARRAGEPRLFEDTLANYDFRRIIDYVAPERLYIQDILANTTDDTLIYLSGSQNFVEGLQQYLRTSGIANSRVIFDFFDGYQEL